MREGETKLEAAAQAQQELQQQLDDNKRQLEAANIQVQQLQQQLQKEQDEKVGDIRWLLCWVYCMAGHCVCMRVVCGS